MTEPFFKKKSITSQHFWNCLHSIEVSSQKDIMVVRQGKKDQSIDQSKFKKLRKYVVNETEFSNIT